MSSSSHSLYAFTPRTVIRVGLSLPVIKPVSSVCFVGPVLFALCALLEIQEFHQR